MSCEEIKHWQRHVGQNPKTKMVSIENKLDYLPFPYKQKTMNFNQIIDEVCEMADIISAYDIRMGDMEGENEDFKSEIENLECRIEDLDGEKEELTSERDSLEEDVADLEFQVGELENQLSDARYEIDQLKAELEELR